MQGYGVGVMRGIIPRAMEQVGVYKSELESKGLSSFFTKFFSSQIKCVHRMGV